MKTRTMFAITLLTTAGCGATFQQLQSRAAFDFDCRPETISAQMLDSQTTIASGCGKQAAYVEHCTSNNHTDCTWMLNSPIRSAPAAPALGSSTRPVH